MMTLGWALKCFKVGCVGFWLRAATSQTPSVICDESPNTGSLVWLNATGLISPIGSDVESYIQKIAFVFITWAKLLLHDFKNSFCMWFCKKKISFYLKMKKCDKFCRDDFFFGKYFIGFFLFFWSQNNMKWNTMGHSVQQEVNYGIKQVFHRVPDSFQRNKGWRGWEGDSLVIWISGLPEWPVLIS